MTPNHHHPNTRANCTNRKHKHKNKPTQTNKQINKQIQPKSKPALSKIPGICEVPESRKPSSAKLHQGCFLRDLNSGIQVDSSGAEVLPGQPLCRHIRAFRLHTVSYMHDFLRAHVQTQAKMNTHAGHTPTSMHACILSNAKPLQPTLQPRQVSQLEDYSTLGGALTVVSWALDSSSHPGPCTPRRRWGQGGEGEGEGRGQGRRFSVEVSWLRQIQSFIFEGVGYLRLCSFRSRPELQRSALLETLVFQMRCWRQQSH